jgi:NAD(P)-dependent dehydrogenase (short-subunit alcohol dehydrogenase family)
VIDRIRSEPGAKDAELELMICDLTDFSAIKAACDDLKAKGWPIHVLLNNAGIQAPYGHLGQKTPGGFEVSERSRAGGGGEGAATSWAGLEAPYRYLGRSFQVAAVALQLHPVSTNS